MMSKKEKEEDFIKFDSKFLEIEDCMTEKILQSLWGFLDNTLPDPYENFNFTCFLFSLTIIKCSI